ncbi:MAG: Xaa-Pro peptidase family protein [bacterium]|nr:Xaa-Pro peptidase family protein [bacterium]
MALSQTKVPERIRRVTNDLQKYGVDALLLKNMEESERQKVSIRYLTGFSGSSSLALLIPKLPKGRTFLTDGRYELQSEEEVREDLWDIVIQKDQRVLREAYRNMRDFGVQRLGLLGDEVSWDFVASELPKNLPGVEIIRLPNIILENRRTKDEEEIKFIVKSLRIIEDAIRALIPKIRPGVSETELEGFLNQEILKRGGTPWPEGAIVASGYRSAIIHGQASSKLLERGDILQLDVGCTYKGYYSDISRVVIVGRATEKQKEMHAAIVYAIDETARLYIPGANCHVVRNAARDALMRAGFPDFAHGLGHGIGLAMHEPPRTSLAVTPDQTLQAGDVLTNEPGIYEEGFGGMRIEETIHITKHGPIVLNNLPRDLIEINV